VQGYYRVEIARGQQGLGNYHLHSKFSTLERTQPSLIPEDNIYAPEKIVERIKGSLDRDPLPTSNTSTHQEQDASTATCQLSQRERAKRVLEQNKINIDPKLHAFTVLGLKCPHIATLFPRETCSCPSTSQCYHILAAKMCIGQDDKSSGQMRKNITQLWKNVYSQKEKKSGRKRSHPGDCDIISAPDAAGNKYIYFLFITALITVYLFIGSQVKHSKDSNCTETGQRKPNLTQPQKVNSGRKHPNPGDSLHAMSVLLMQNVTPYYRVISIFSNEAFNRIKLPRYCRCTAQSRHMYL